MADNQDQAAIERINLIYQRIVAGEKVNPSDVAKIGVALERVVKERDALLKVRDELIDIAHGQTMFDEFNKRYTHSFMSDGEALWRLLGFDDKCPYIPEAEFDAAVQRFKDKGARDDRV